MDRILVLQLKRIGDLVLTAPLTAALRERFPDAHITLLSRGVAGQLAPLLPGVDECLIQRPGRLQPGLWGKVMRGHYDTVLDVTGNDRSALLAFLSRAKRKITYERHCRDSRLRRRIYNLRSPASVRSLHTVDYHLALLESLGVAPPENPRVGGLRVPEDTGGVRERLRVAAGGRPLAVVHPGTMAPNKFWLAERWAKVIDHLKSKLGYAVALSFGPAPDELGHISDIVAACREGVDFREGMSLCELVIMLEASQLLVSVDTGAMHVAGGLEIPQVALFGPTNPYHWRPRHDGAAIVCAGEAGEGAGFAPKRKGRPMAELATSAVLAALDGLLSRPRGVGRGDLAEDLVVKDPSLGRVDSA